MSDSPASADPPEEEQALSQLRQLLVGKEQQQLTQIQERIEDPELHAEDISRILPEAVIIRTARDEKLARALSPTIEDAFQHSIRKDPKSLVDAISPIMGPAIRRAILQTIGGMVQSFNQTLEQSVSVRGLKWRLEALRTGKPFGEVVLLHTLLYQVEQIFLIHQETGLLLQHISASSVQVMDADMVSGMLTAIRDFVHDSFGGEHGQELDTMQVGERTVWIEQESGMALALVLRGTAPQELRGLMREALENVYLEQKDTLAGFEGDATPFETSRQHLEECLRSQFREDGEGEVEGESGRKRRLTPAFWLVVAAVLGLGGWWVYGRYQAASRWSDFLAVAGRTPGIVVTDAGKTGDTYFIVGLRDPLAPSPEALWRHSGLADRPLDGRFETYMSYHPPFVLARARQALQPPAGVDIELAAGGVLQLSGRAPHNWIDRARLLTAALPGVSGLDATRLENADRQEAAALRAQIEDTALYFDVGATTLAADQMPAFNGLADAFARLARLPLDLDPGLKISGYADPSGNERGNQQLSRRRAESVAALLAQRGIARNRLFAVGMGADAAGADLSRSRHVSFAVIGVDSP